MTTDLHMAKLEELGRELAAIAVDTNEFGPPDYGKFLRAFAAAYPVLLRLEDQVAGSRGLGLDDELPWAVVDAFNAEVHRLLVELGLGVTS